MVQIPNPNTDELREEMASQMYAALASEHGIALRSNDPTRLRIKLYALRAKLSDPSLSGITFALIEQGQVWIIKQNHPTPTLITTEYPNVNDE